MSDPSAIDGAYPLQRLVTSDELGDLQQKHDELAAHVGSNFADMERRFNESIKEGPAYRALVAEIEELKKVHQKQREDHTKLWNWVKAIEQRLIRAERQEPPAKLAKETSDA